MGGNARNVDCRLGFKDKRFAPKSKKDPKLTEILEAHENGEIRVEGPVEIGTEGDEIYFCCGYYATKGWLDNNFPGWEERGVRLKDVDANGKGIVLNMHHVPYCARCPYNNIK